MYFIHATLRFTGSEDAGIKSRIVGDFTLTIINC
jgi:hypothetical protein